MAHIDQPKGIFYESVKPRDNGKIGVSAALSRILNEAPYDAVECSGNSLPTGFDEIHHVRRRPAFYQASDNPDPENPTKHAFEGLAVRHSFFSVDEVNLEGLRQCFVDPESRIHPMGAATSITHPKIVSMKVGNNGFLAGEKFEFHEGLNYLIGGKGVGKSLVIEFLRFGLEQPSGDVEIQRDHAKKLNKRLAAGNSIEIVYQTPNGTQFQITRLFANAGEKDNLDIQASTTCVNLSTGEKYSGDIRVAFPMLAYSQTEVISIAEDKDAQLDLIDRFIDTRDVDQRIAQLIIELRENDARLDKSLRASEKLEECDREIQTLQLQVDEITNALANPVFERMKASESKMEALERCQGSATALRDQLLVWAAEIDELGLPETPQDLARDALLEEQRAKLGDLQVRVSKTISELAANVATTQGEMAAATEGWLPEFEKMKTDYNTMLQQIGGDQQKKETERQRLEKRKAEVEEEALQYRAQKDALKGVFDERETKLNQLTELQQSIYATRQQKYDELTSRSEGKLRLTLTHSANTKAFEDKLIELLKGGPSAPSVGERRKIAQKVTPRRFVELVVGQKVQDLASEAEIGEALAKRVIERLRAVDDFVEVLALQHNCYPGDVPAIEYRKEGGEYAELDELSVGQKCTALLIIALCDGTMPVVIDQPEDALDIISVWEDIAKKLRRGKNSRQFILTTHNSSVAVAADSDQFIVLKAGANTGSVVAAGAIDRPEVKRAVIEHMEGGEEPYRLRAQKYNIG